jgi:pimeloyl-ACP methyl ester carboxylesterase
MAQRALPVRAFRIMEGVSHWLMMDRPEAFDRHLDELLAEVR